MKALKFSIILEATMLLDSCSCGQCYFERVDWPYYIVLKSDTSIRYIYFIVDSAHSIYEPFGKDYQDTINFYKNKSNFQGYGQNILLDDRCSEKYKYSKVRDKIKITENCK